MASKKPPRKPPGGKSRSRASKKAAAPKAPKKPAAPRRRRGAPSKFRPEYVEVAREMCWAGAIVPELAQEFGVVPSTIWRWATTYPEFRSAIEVGKSAADDRVERSLFERATGYVYPAAKTFANGGRPVTVYAPEHVPADVTAARLWLTNRRPTRWRDRTEVDASLEARVRSEQSIDLSNMSNEALLELAKALGLDGPASPPAPSDPSPSGPFDPGIIAAPRAKATYDAQRRQRQEEWDRETGGAE